MDIVDAAQLGDERWDLVCGAAMGAWFWHTSAWRDYTVAYRPALQSQSLAFAVVDRGQPLALVPLMVENDPGGFGRRFSFGGDACWSPAMMAGADHGRQRTALRTVLEHIDLLAADHGVDSVALRLSPLAAGWIEYAPLFLAATTRAGYVDASVCSQVIDLGREPQAIRAAMTRATGRT